MKSRESSKEQRLAVGFFIKNIARLYKCTVVGAVCHKHRSDCLRGRRGAKWGVGIRRVIIFDILLTIPLLVKPFKGTNSKMFHF